MGRLGGFHGRSQIRSRRRQVAWDGGPFMTITDISATGKLLWTIGVVLDKDEESTIVRIRGQILARLVLSTAAGDGMSFAVGLGLVNSQAFTAGAGSVPGPGTDPDWGGWLWHQYFYVYGTAAQSLGQDTARNANSDVRIEIDSKAMRKMDSNQTLFGMFEVQAEAGTATVRLLADTRVLVKLP